MVEIDRLPHVQRDRARANVGWVNGAGSHRLVKTCAGTVDAIGRIDRPNLRCLIGLVRLQDDFAGQQQFTGTQAGATDRGALENVAVVSAPREREAPSFTGLKTGALGERELNQGVVVPGATFTALAHPRTNTDWSALWVALVEPAAGEIE